MFRFNLSRWLLLLLLLTAFKPSLQAQELSDLTIYLVRHAEKENTGKDPNLSQLGKERAKALAALLDFELVTEIYSTNYKRTLETAEPLASQKNLTVELYDPSKLNAFAETLKQKSTGIIVVIGHSNTTPKLVSFISGQAIDPMDETEYEHVYILNRRLDGKFSVNHLKLVCRRNAM